jgi:Flp pilus assembly protein TadD
MRAERAIAEGDLARAVADYVTVVNAQPDNAAAWYRLGAVYLRQRKAELAQTAFEEALRGDPRLSKANANLAISLLLQFRDAAARAIASKDVPESNREALQALLRDVDRTLALPGPAGVR